MKLRTLALMLLMVCSSLISQTPSPHSSFIVFQSATGAVAVVTVQLPAAAAKGIHFLGAYATCSGGCNVLQELAGPAATATAFTPLSLTRRGESTVAKAFTASNATAVSSPIPGIPVPATVAQSIDLSSIWMPANQSTMQVFTMRTDNAVGTNAIVIVYEEVSLTN